VTKLLNRCRHLRSNRATSPECRRVESVESPEIKLVLHLQVAKSAKTGFGTNLLRSWPTNFELKQMS
jgi:hypothetical protein